ncbi:MAG TPA: serine hydrolase, partial [Bacillota bacterium]|nr:serine hydrolase [Bacillota bacterium]
MKKTVILLMVLCLLVMIPQVAAAEPAIVALRGSVRIQGLGFPVYDKDGDVRHAPASVTKVMTILLALESGRLDETVTVSQRATTAGGSSLYMRPGSQWSMLDLIYAAQLISANDAAAAIAEHLGGSIEGFAVMMNAKALELGMLNTNFINPHGMPHKDQYSTAHDLTLLALAAARNPQFIEISTTRRYVTANQTALANQDKLLGEYRGLVIGKTGYTDAAGQCFLVVAEREGLRVAIVILGSQGQNIWSDSVLLLDHGFDNYRNNVLFRPRQTLGVVDVAFSGKVIVVAAAGYEFVSSRNERPPTRVELYPYPSLWPPLKPGDLVGEAVVLVDGKRSVVPLTVASYVPLFTPERLKISGVVGGLILLYAVGSAIVT